MDKLERKAYMEKWREANSEHIKNYGKGYRSNIDNIDNLKNKNKKYYQDNKEVLKEQAKINGKIYYQDNKEHLKELARIYKQNNKVKRNNSQKERKLIDPVYRLRCNIRLSILRAFKNNGYSKKSKTYDLLGCSYEEFLTHIESNFENWMNWDNHGKYDGLPNSTWQLDHIIPISSAVTEEDVINLSHHTNYQPLCSFINQNIKRNNL